MELKNILLLDKKKKIYYTHYEIGDILEHDNTEGYEDIDVLHYLIEDIRIDDNLGVYDLRVLEDNSTFSWDVEIVDRTRKIKKVA